MTLFEIVSAGVLCYLALAMALIRMKPPGSAKYSVPVRGRQYIAEAQVYVTLGSISIFLLIPYLPLQIAVFTMATIATTLHLFLWLNIPSRIRAQRPDKSEDSDRS
jgi:hypothetical protein